MSLLMVGVLGVVALVTVWLLLTWWLYMSPLREPIPCVPNTEAYLKLKQGLVFIMLAAQFIAFTGGHWDAAWHIKYGLVLQDFWWAPHIMIYMNFGVTALIAAFSVLKVLSLPGSTRACFRAEPMLGALFLFAFYQTLSGPLDQVWHRIYGVDISGLSLPHVILVFIGLLTALAVAGLQVDLSQRRTESKSLLWLSLIPIAVAFWAWLAVAVGDWELTPPRDTLPAWHLLLTSPGWWYIVRGLVPGAFVVGTAAGLVGTRWAATTLTLILNAWSMATFGVLSLFGIPTAHWGAALFCLAAAAPADVWRQRAGQRRPAVEGLAFAGVYLVVGILATTFVTRITTLTAGDVGAAVPVGLFGGTVAFVAGNGAGAWLRSLPDRAARPDASLAVSK